MRGQLALEARDLLAQRAPRGCLVDVRAQRQGRNRLPRRVARRKLRECPGVFSAQARIAFPPRLRPKSTNGRERPARALSSELEYVGASPQRLLDADVGDARRPAPRRARCGAVSPRHPAPAAVSPNTRPTECRSSAITIVPSELEAVRGPAEALAGLGDAQPELALDAVGVEGAHRHAGLDHGHRERVVDDVAAPEPAGAQALEHRGLARRPDAGRGRSRSGGRRRGRRRRSARGACSAPAARARGPTGSAAAGAARAGCGAARRGGLRLQQGEARELRAQRGLHPAPRRERGSPASI